METNLKTLRNKIEYLRDATTKSPKILEATLVAALEAIEAELEDIKQEIRDITA